VDDAGAVAAPAEVAVGPTVTDVDVIDGPDAAAAAAAVESQSDRLACVSS